MYNGPVNTETFAIRCWWHSKYVLVYLIVLVFFIKWSSYILFEVGGGWSSTSNTPLVGALLQTSSFYLYFKSLYAISELGKQKQDWVAVSMWCDSVSFTSKLAFYVHNFAEKNAKKKDFWVFLAWIPHNWRIFAVLFS